MSNDKADELIDALKAHSSKLTELIRETSYVGEKLQILTAERAEFGLAKALSDLGKKIDDLSSNLNR